MTGHDVVYLPSASSLAVLRQEISGRRPAPKTVAVLADPVFDEDDARVIHEIGTGAARPGVRVAANNGRDGAEGRALGLPTPLERSMNDAALGSGGSLPRLPFSRREAAAIGQVSPTGKVFAALDFRASKEVAAGTDLSQYRIVHFASHALLDSVNPELSGIVLSLVDKRGSPVDGFLRLHDIYNLALPADLIVLSGCRTALGKEVKGEGLVGLTQGFMYSGAARVVASLWNVDDAATAELMSIFYRHMLLRHLPPAAALRSAQLEMSSKKRWRDPYYWASFQLQGEWK